MKEFKNDRGTSKESRGTSKESRGTSKEPRTPKKPPKKGTKASSTCHKPPQKGKKGPKEIDVSRAIITLRDNLRRNPYLIHSEFDMQSMLYMELLKMDDELYDTGIEINNEIMKTQRVHRDYPYGGNVGGKFDVVVFDPKVMNNIKNKNSLGVGDKGEGICTDLIEMKYVRGHLQKEALYIKDMMKLKNAYGEYKIKPKLFFIFYVYWEITGKADINKHMHTFKELYKTAISKPIINYYLFIGPTDTWTGYFGGFNLLDLYKGYGGTKTRIEFFL